MSTHFVLENGVCSELVPAGVRVRTFKTKAFTKFARKEHIADAALADAVSRVEQGLIDADLGHGLFKQRVARPGQGKSGGYRTIIACRLGDRAVFLHGFAKSEQDNISDADLELLKDAADQVLRWTAKQIETQLLNGSWVEIDDGP